MAYIDQDQPAEPESASTVTPPASTYTSSQALYKAMKNKQPKKDYSDLIKIVVTGIAVIFYIRPIARLSSDLAIYEFVALLLFGITGAFMARHKENSLNGFLLGVLMCPLGLIMAAYLDDKTKTPCKHCAELIKTEAVICPFCNSSVIG